MMKYLYMMKNFLKSFFCVNMAVIIVGVMPGNVYALTDAELEMFAQNNILFYDPGNAMCVDDVDGFFSMEQNASIVIGTLMAAGYTHESALAVAGNIKGESSFNSRVIEGGKNVEDGWRAWDNGAKTFKGGFGLVQWTTAGRVQRLQEYADSQNLWVGSLRAQIGFMIEELSGNFGPDRMNGMSFEEATFLIYRRYETPGSSFWTIHDGKYYNDYAPGSFSELSETRTPAAYKAFYKRFNAAKDLADLAPAQLSNSCSPRGGAGAILAENAVNMAWPDANGMCLHDGELRNWVKHKNVCNNDVKAAYREAIIKVRGHKIDEYRDCGVFVSAVVRSSGVDPDWKKNSGTSALYDYMEGSSKWQRVENIGNTTNLMPGDILVIKKVSSDGYGHIMMYTGDYSKYGNLAMAALRHYTGKMFDIDEHYGKNGYYGDKRGKYSIFRFVGGS